jgi:hypothetical protein
MAALRNKLPNEARWNTDTQCSSRCHDVSANDVSRFMILLLVALSDDSDAGGFVALPPLVLLHRIRAERLAAVRAGA